MHFMKYLARAIFRLLASAILKREQPMIVAVAGSVGKTGTKEAIAAALASPRRPVRKTVGSFNAEIGVPVTIITGGPARTSVWQWFAVIVRGCRQLLWRRPYPQALVLEVGADKPGDLRPLLELIHPTVGVLTALTPEHMEFFDTIEAVVAEESLVLRLLPKNGTAIVNLDDQHSQAVMKQLSCQIKTFGWSPDADIRIDQVRPTMNDHGLPTGQIVKLAVEGSVIPVALPGVIGRHQAYPIAIAVAVARASGDEVFDAVQRLSQYQVPPGRMRVFEGVEGSVIIDDSYNASPEAMTAALETLVDLEIPGKKHAILGQMSELGSTSVEWHTKIGQSLSAEKITTLVTVGPIAKRIGEAAIVAHFPTARVFNVATAEAAALVLRPHLNSGDAVLVKGSRYANRLERAVKILLAHPEKDGQHLVGAGE